jgi:hypothetical protein
MPLWETPDGMPPGLLLPLHPGDWRLHSIAMPRYGTLKGDFTPQYVSHDIEIRITVLQQIGERLAEALGIDQAGPIGSRRLPPPGGIPHYPMLPAGIGRGRSDIEAG